MTKVTRIAVCETANAGKRELLVATAIPLVRLRQDVWRMFAGRKVWKLQQARNCMKKAGLTAQFYGVPYELWSEAINDTLSNITAWRAGMVETSDFKSFVFKRLNGDENKDARKQVFTDAKYRRQVFTHPACSRKLRNVLSSVTPEGKSERLHITLTKNAYGVKTDTQGRVWLSMSTVRKGQPIRLNLDHFPYPISGTINVIVENNHIAVHVPVDEELTSRSKKPRPQPNPMLKVGVDSGVTEVFATSDGEFVGHNQGSVINDDADALRERGRHRGRLHKVAERHEEKAAAALENNNPELAKHHTAKAKNLRAHNLTKVKQNRQTKLRRAQVKNAQYQAVHNLCDTYGWIVAEKLTMSGKGKKSSRGQNNRNSSWQRSTRATALESVTRRRGSTLLTVNAAYTSQWIHACGHFGVRSGDSIYCDNENCPNRGGVWQADINAALNILDRAFDDEIQIWMKPQKVKQILTSRVRTNHPRHEIPSNDGEGSSRDNPCANDPTPDK